MVVNARRKSDPKPTELAARFDPLAPQVAGEAPPTIDTKFHTLLNRYLAVHQELIAANDTIAELFRLAHFDKLTGLAKQSLMEEEFNAATAKAQQVGIIFIDLNGFKQINDKYGHNIGDEALKLAAAALAKTTRKTDLVIHLDKTDDDADKTDQTKDMARNPADGKQLPVRYAGDEFAILISGDSVENIDAIVQHVKDVFQNLTLTVNDTAIPVRASIGHHIRQGDESLAECIEHADALMYHDKKASKPIPPAPYARTLSGYAPTPSALPNTDAYLSFYLN